jgi:anti-sigma B factor antagonist
MAKGDVGQRQDGALGLLDFPRDVTAQTRETAYFAYNELARAKVKAVGFNFSTTDYMNSAGIGLIINLVEDATQAGRKVFAYGLGSHYRKLFGMVGLTERITLVADEKEVKEKSGTSAEPANNQPPAASAKPADNQNPGDAQRPVDSQKPVQDTQKPT